MVASLKNLLLWLLRFFKRLSIRKKILVIIVLGVVVLIGSSIFSASNQQKYTFAQVTKSDIQEVVAETGNIASNGKIDVYSPTTGVVEMIYVKNGDPVIVGQTLFEIKSSATEQEKAQALAAYLSAKNSLDTAQATLYSLQSTMFSKWDTFKELAEGDDYEQSDGTPRYEQRGLPEFHIAEKDWLAAEANFKKQQAVISQAQAAVTSTYLTYQATQNATVKATAAGTISNLSVTAGNSVKANLAAAPAAPLASIANFASSEVVVSLSETDIAKVKEGQEAEIDVSAVSDHIYSGTVSRVDMIGTDTAGVIRYNVYIRVTDADERLRPGMTVDVDIITEKLADVLSVPNAAVKPYQGGRAVRVLNQQTKQIEYIPVKVGIKGDTNTQILEGLSEGQSVITSLSNEQLRRPGLFGN